MYDSTIARIAAAIAAVGTTSLLFALVVSLSEPAATDENPKLAQVTAPAIVE